MDEIKKEDIANDINIDKTSDNFKDIEVLQRTNSAIFNALDNLATELNMERMGRYIVYYNEGSFYIKDFYTSEMIKISVQKA